jgi:hypothetical protein
MRYAAGGGLTAEGGGPPGECAAAGRIDVRAGHGRPPDREDLAGEHEIGVPVAAGLACRRHAALAPRGMAGMHPSWMRPSWRSCAPRRQGRSATRGDTTATSQGPTASPAARLSNVSIRLPDCECCQLGSCHNPNAEALSAKAREDSPTMNAKLLRAPVRPVGCWCRSTRRPAGCHAMR